MPAGASSSSGTTPAAGAPIGPGRVVLIVGPSGAGKDAILQEARRRLAGDERFVFPRRVVTRDGNAAEEHDTLSRAAFEARLAQGGFALHWEAHGLLYGIKVEIDEAVLSRRIVLLNASRQIVPLARQRFAATVAVLIDAPLEVRAARLAARNRERPEEVLARLSRVVAGFRVQDADLVIDNDAGLADAVERLVVWLRNLP